jgi:Flp pilus assembly protein TadG
MTLGATSARGLRQRRGTVAVMTALMLPALMGCAGMAIDMGVWYREYVRLQLAADAGAEGAARLLAAQTSGNAPYQSAALIEVNGVTGDAMIGTLHTPVTVSVAADYSKVTVTLTSTADSYFVRALHLSGPAISVSATAGVIVTPPQACVLALNKTAQNAIQVDNMGSIVATGCPIFSDSSSATAIYLNSGTIKGTSIGAVGAVAHSNSGSNTLSPAGTNYQPSESDPYAGLSVPGYGACNYTNASFTAYQSTPYQFTQAKNVFCGNTTIGGNGSTDTFAPGTYYIVNGNLTFNNASVTSASGVTFVLTGSSPGALSWTNYSNTTTMTAPTSGALAGILVWQTCGTSGSDPANTMAGGSTLQASGAIYTPCGALNLSNNIQLKPTTGGNLNVVAQTIYATGSAGLYTNSSGGSSSSSYQIVLLQ